MVEAGRGGAGRERVAQQQPAAAAELEQPVAGPQGQHVQDRPARELVRVLGAVDLARPVACRPPRDAIGQPVLERRGGEAARLPRRLVLVAEPELPEHRYGVGLSSASAASTGGCSAAASTRRSQFESART